MKNKCETIIQKLRDLGLEGAPLRESDIKVVENSLDFLFPEDFLILNQEHSYEHLGDFEYLNYLNNTSKRNIVNFNKMMYELWGLPINYLVIADDGTSLILLSKNKDNTFHVIWASYEDVMNLCAGKPFEYDPTIFNSFADFYEFLLEEEEKLRKEAQEDEEG